LVDLWGGAFINRTSYSITICETKNGKKPGRGQSRGNSSLPKGVIISLAGVTHTREAAIESNRALPVNFYNFSPLGVPPKNVRVIKSFLYTEKC
jgi:hypothetical protein